MNYALVLLFCLWSWQYSEIEYTEDAKCHGLKGGYFPRLNKQGLRPRKLNPEQLAALRKKRNNDEKVTEAARFINAPL
jgi:hypothetical protein